MQPGSFAPATATSLYVWKSLAYINNAAQMRVDRVMTIRLVKPMIAVGPAVQESYRPELAKLVVNGVNVQAALQRKFSNIPLRPRQ